MDGGSALSGKKVIEGLCFVLKPGLQKQIFYITLCV
jgi:hypothetical protein